MRRGRNRERRSEGDEHDGDGGKRAARVFAVKAEGPGHDAWWRRRSQRTFDGRIDEIWFVIAGEMVGIHVGGESTALPRWKAVLTSYEKIGHRRHAVLSYEIFLIKIGYNIIYSLK